MGPIWIVDKRIESNIIKLSKDQRNRKKLHGHEINKGSDPIAIANGIIAGWVNIGKSGYSAAWYIQL